MENFVHIITYKGMKIAFKHMDELNDFIAKNQMNRVHVTSIQYYKDKSTEKGKSE